MPHRKLVIDIPDNITVPPNINQDQQLMRDAIAVVLYNKGRLSMQEARGFMGISRREFEEVLLEYGIPMMDENDLFDELNARETF